MERLRQRIKDEIGVHRPTDPPAHEAAREPIDVTMRSRRARITRHREQARALATFRPTSFQAARQLWRLRRAEPP